MARILQWQRTILGSLAATTKFEVQVVPADNWTWKKKSLERYNPIMYAQQHEQSHWEVNSNFFNIKHQSREHIFMQTLPTVGVLGWSVKKKKEKHWYKPFVYKVLQPQIESHWQVVPVTSSALDITWEVKVVSYPHKVHHTVMTKVTGTLIHKCARNDIIKTKTKIECCKRCSILIWCMRQNSRSSYCLPLSVPDNLSKSIMVCMLSFHTNICFGKHQY